MNTRSFLTSGPRSARGQRGVTTLLVVLVILVILTIIVLSSSNVALFEQKTATNENRQRLAEQSAEYALSLAGEYLKANVTKISTTNAGGWLDAATAANVRWKTCAGITDITHPCFAEPNATTRAQLYYYTTDGSTVAAGNSVKLNLPYDSLVPTAIKLGTTGSGGSSAFTTTSNVRALLCRIDTSLNPVRCQATPAAGRRIAITLISQADLTSEGAQSVVKETWGTLPKSGFAASVPLVASGLVQFVGNFTVVSAPNAGGYGIAGATWSPKDVEGNGSFQSCHMDDYLGGLPLSQLTTDPGCAEGKTCSCDTEVLSSKTAEGLDTLDVDGSTSAPGDDATKGPLPDITFFPGVDKNGVRMDDAADNTDDSLFEWIFGVDVTGGNGTAVLQNCANTLGGNNTDCERSAMSDMGFTVIADCEAIGPNSSGLLYFPGGAGCNIGKDTGQAGSPSSPIVLVVDQEFTAGHVDLLYGMVFVRSPPNAGTGIKPLTAEVKGNAKGMVFGSIVIEGDAKLNGTMDMIYLDTSAGGPNDPLPESTRFARLPGSWLDSSTGF